MSSHWWVLYMSSHSYSSFPPHQWKLLSSGHASDRNQKTSEKHKDFTDKPRGEIRVFHGNFSDFYCGMLADNQTWTASYSAQFLPNSSHFFRIFPSLTTSLCPVTKFAHPPPPTLPPFLPFPHFSTWFDIYITFHSAVSVARSGIKNSVCFPALVAGGIGILDIGPVARSRSILSLFALIVNVYKWICGQMRMKLSNIWMPACMWLDWLNESDVIFSLFCGQIREISSLWSITWFRRPDGVHTAGGKKFICGQLESTYVLFVWIPAFYISFKFFSFQSLLFSRIPHWISLPTQIKTDFGQIRWSRNHRGWGGRRSDAQKL